MHRENSFAKINPASPMCRALAPHHEEKKSCNPGKKVTNINGQSFYSKPAFKKAFKPIQTQLKIYPFIFLCVCKKLHATAKSTVA